MRFSRIVQFAVLNLRRRFQQHWLFWVSILAGVALVGIGSGVAQSIDSDMTGKPMNSRRITEILEWCAIVVVGIHGVMMSARILQSDSGFFRLFFAFGFTPTELGAIRGTELFLGLSIAVIGGLAVSSIALSMTFGTKLWAFHGGCSFWSVVVGYLPMLVLPFFLRTTRLTHHR